MRSNVLFWLLAVAHLLVYGAGKVESSTNGAMQRCFPVLFGLDLTNCFATGQVCPPDVFDCGDGTFAARDPLYCCDFAPCDVDCEICPVGFFNGCNECRCRPGSIWPRSCTKNKCPPTPLQPKRCFRNNPPEHCPSPTVTTSPAPTAENSTQTLVPVPVPVPAPAPIVPNPTRPPVDDCRGPTGTVCP
jgi:hypothetical protein